MNVTLEHAHDRQSISDRVNGRTQHSYLRDFVYGAIDGTVTTFAVVSGIAGAGLNPEIVVVLGLANLVGDGFSMAASNYFGTRTDQQLREKARAMEQRHIRITPEGEREEVRQIFAAKGFKGADLERAVEIITSNEKLWVDTMLVDELGINLEGPSAFRAAATTFFAFCLVGLLPLLAFIFGFLLPSGSTTLFFVSTVMTGVAFFFVGAAKSIFVEQKWYWAGMETLGVGAVAAGLAYVVGMLLKGTVGS
jgi:VIT1/CCC1 family predicted Fe2+/Mn2+ transporter